jgi:D-alanyl-D-alanine carboxypeptidase
MNTLFTLLFSGQFLFFEPYNRVEVPLVLNPSAPVITLRKKGEIYAGSALIMEVSSGMVIYKKNIFEKRSIASLTKLMTALVVLEEKNIWETVVVSENAANIEGSQMHLLMGEELTVSGLLSGLLIRSANDAAIVLSENVEESQKEFIQKMNLRAHYLGLKDTHFSNPHGLDDPENYSTAFDIALLAKKVIDIPFIRQTVQKTELTIYDTSKEFPHKIKNTNELLFTPLPVYGIKTGTTDEAGECFVGLVREKGKEYIFVILGSTDRFQDARTLLWILRNG